MSRSLVRNCSILFVLLFLLATLAACGSSTSAGMPDVEMDNVNGFLDGDIPSKGDYEYGSENSESAENTPNDSNRKIIERIRMSVQTKAFDALLQQVDERVASFGGYSESSEVSGNSFESVGRRDARLVLRIPSQKSAEFINFVSNNSTVTNKEVTTEDVTLQYVDIESRISALNLEKASLERLLADATSMSDIIKIQDRLTDVIYQIESAKSRLRVYDNLVDYTTITLYIYEVERTTVVVEQTVWEEIATRFVENVQDIGDGFVDLFVFIVSESPYILIYVLIGVIAYFIIQYFSKRSSRKRLKNMSSAQSMSNKEQ